MSTCRQAIAARRKTRKDSRYASKTRKDPVRQAQKQMEKVARARRIKQGSKKK